MILRVLVITLAGLEALSCAVLAVVLYNSASDPLGRNIANGVAAVTAIPLILCALSALILRLFDRWLPFALDTRARSRPA